MKILKYIFFLSLFLSHTSFASSELEEDRLQAHILKKLDTSEEDLEKAINKAHIELRKPGFNITDPRTRAAICQLIAWYSLEIINSQEATLDDFLIYLLSMNNRERIPATFDARIDLKENLQNLAFNLESNRKLEDFRDLLEHGLIYRALKHLLNGENPERFIPKGNRWRKIENVNEMDQILATTKMRAKTLILAYYEGVPTQEHVYTLNTVSRIFVLKFNLDSQRWEVQKEKVQSSSGFGKYKLVRKSTQSGQNSYSLTNDPSAENAEFYNDQEILPTDGEDYIVVHMGNVHTWSKSFDNSYSEALGFDKVNFEEMFLYKKDVENLPGVLTLFHCNLIRNFSMNFFNSLESFEIKNPYYPKVMKNFPLTFESDGDIAYYKDGKHFEFRPQVQSMNGTLFLANTVFRRVLRMAYKDCLMITSVYRLPHNSDWVEFIDRLKEYVKQPDFTPRVQTLLGTKGITKESSEFLKVSGPLFIENAKRDLENTYTAHMYPQAEEILERTHLQKDRLSSVRKTQLHSGIIVPSRIAPQEPYGDSLFHIVGISRKQFIEDLLKIKTSLDPDPHHLKLVNNVLSEIDTNTLEEWALLFDNPHIYLSFVHLELIAELYNFRFFLYELDRPLEYGSDAIFVPLKAEQKVIGSGSNEIHIALVNKQFVDRNYCHIPFQYEQLHVGNPKNTTKVEEGYSDWHLQSLVFHNSVF